MSPSLQKLGRGKDTVIQIVSFGAGEGLARALNWGTMALLPFLLSSTEEYGRIGLLVSIEVLISNISLVGLDRAVLRFYANDKLPGKFLKSVLILWACFALLPLATVVSLYLSGLKVVFGIPLVPHLFLLSLSVAAFNLHFLCICISRAKAHLKIFLRFRLYYMTIKFVSVIVLAKILGHSLSYVAAVTISSLLMLIVIVPFLHDKVSGKSDRAVIGQLLIFGWPFVFHVISGNILSYFSRFFLEFYCTMKDVGMFTFSFTLGSALYLGYAILNTYFEPRIYSHAADTKLCEKWLFLYTNTCIIISSFGGACMIFFFPYLIPYLQADYRNALPIISMIIATVLLNPVYLQGNYRLTVYKATGYIAGATFLSACLNIALNFLLIPSRGIWGAVMSLYIANIFLSVWILIISLRISRIPLKQLRSLSSYAICIIGSFSLILCTSMPELSIFILLVVCLLTFGLLIRSVVNRGELST